MLSSKPFSVPGGWSKDTPAEEHHPPTYSDAGGDENDPAVGIVKATGDIVDQTGKTVGKVTEGKAADLVGNTVNTAGEIVGKDGSVVGKALPLEETSGNASKAAESTDKKGGWNVMGTAKSAKNLVGTVDNTVKTAGKLQPATDKLAKGLGLGSKKEEENPDSEAAENKDSAVPKEVSGVDDKAKDLGETTKKSLPVDEGKAGLEETPATEDVTKKPEDIKSGALKDGELEKVDNPEDFIVKGDENIPDTKPEVGDVVGAKDTALSDVNTAVPEEGQEIVDPLAKPFENFEGAVVGEDGKVILDGNSIGEVVEGEAKDLKGKHIDAEGNIVNDTGTIVGKAELKDELKEELKQAGVDTSILNGAKVNKAGNVVNEKGEVIGRVTEGILKHLVGKKADADGQFWNDQGKIIGKAEPIPETEREEYKEPAPFEDFPDATVRSDGKVVFNGEAIGIVVQGDPKALKGKKVDDDGDILDKSGNVIGKAERWEEEEAPPPEPEVEPDRSILAGKRVNKAGNVVDASGQIYGRLVEGDPKRLNGRMCDKDGNVRSESGDIIGKAELVPEGEREGFKEGPFAELPGCTVTKEGKIVTPGGDVVGRLVSGDPKVLFGRSVDDDGDILDRNGNSIGKAERWEEPVVEKKKGPMAGRRVNREGNVVDEDGNLIGKLTSGELSICSGKEIDDDGDVIDSKGNTIGHVNLLADIPEPEPSESAEDKEKREQLEKDKKLANQLAVCIEQCLDKIRPICKMITQKVEKAERTPKEELDEEELVKEVKPLIEEGSKILQEANGMIRGLDPDGRIQANAKHKTATREASPEEYHLADVLKELTGTITECIDGAKRKIEDMPHAKKELNPLWGLLTEPLFQILAAVGLLLNGVLSLVGRLLSGLGLGGLVDSLLGGLGLTRLLESLGVGGVVGSLTGKKDNKKSKGPLGLLG